MYNYNKYVYNLTNSTLLNSCSLHVTLVSGKPKAPLIKHVERRTKQNDHTGATTETNPLQMLQRVALDLVASANPMPVSVLWSVVVPPSLPLSLPSYSSISHNTFHHCCRISLLLWMEKNRMKISFIPIFVLKTITVNLIDGCCTTE